MKLVMAFCIWMLLNDHCHAAMDTLSAKEKEELRQALLQTSLGANFQADMYSQKGDSAKAGEYLVKSDPHYLLFLGQTPQTLPEFLSRFKSTQADKDKYIAAFTTLYNAPKNEFYTRFKAMYKEDQSLRNKQNNCNTTALCKQLDKQITHTDSIHAAYLYNYVMKNAWPTLENGGLYANIIAVHDHRNHGFYIPYLKQAIQRGQSTLDVLEIVNYYHSTDNKHGNALQKFLDTSKKYSFDVSSLLNFKLATSVSEIKKVVDQHCPVEYYLVFYAPKYEMMQAWFARSIAHRNQDPDENVMQQFFSQIRKGCMGNRRPEMLKNVWSVSYLPSDTRRAKMILYVLYK